MLLVVGGLAMAAIQDDRTTQDIDVVLSAIPEPVADAAKLVAERHGISTSWMNNQVAALVDADLPSEAFSEIYAGEVFLTLRDIFGWVSSSIGWSLAGCGCRV